MPNFFADSKKKTAKDSIKTKEKRKKYNEDDLIHATNAVKCGMSRKNAAKLFQVPRSAIQIRSSNPDKTNQRPGQPTILTLEEETALVNWIKNSTKKGFPRSKEDIESSVTEFLRNTKTVNSFKNHQPGKKWMRLFLKRHPEIAMNP